MRNRGTEEQRNRRTTPVVQLVSQVPLLRQKKTGKLRGRGAKFVPKNLGYNQAHPAFQMGIITEYLKWLNMLEF